MDTSLDQTLLEAFAAAHPELAARTLDGFDEGEASQALALLSPQRAAAIVRHLVPVRAAGIVTQLPDGGAPVLEAMPPDLAVGVLRCFEPARRAEIVAKLSPGRVKTIEPLLRFRADSAGGLSDPLAPTFRAEVTVGDAIGRLRGHPEELLYYVYVLGTDQRLVGALSLRELMRASEDATLGSIMHAQPIALRAHASIATVLANPGWRAVHALPVVDAGDRFVGVLRYDRLRSLETGHALAAAPDGSMAVDAMAELYGLGLGSLAALGATMLGGSREVRS